MTCGIYAIRNKINGKIYVGQSVNIRRRWQKHRRELRKGTAHNSSLQTDYDHYGPEAFEYAVLEICFKELLDLREKEWMHFFGSIAPTGYNIYAEGKPRDNSAMCAALKRADVRARMSEAAKRRATRPGEKERRAALMRKGLANGAGRYGKKRNETSSLSHD